MGMIASLCIVIKCYALEEKKGLVLLVDFLYNEPFILTIKLI